MIRLSYKVSCVLASLLLSQTPLNAQTHKILDEVKLQLPKVREIRDREALQNFIFHNSSQLSPRTLSSLVQLISKNTKDSQQIIDDFLPEDLRAQVLEKISQKENIINEIGDRIVEDKNRAETKPSSAFPDQNPALSPSGIGTVCCLTSDNASS